MRGFAKDARDAGACSVGLEAPVSRATTFTPDQAKRLTYKDVSEALGA